jgi:hypothetical protein
LSFPRLVQPVLDKHCVSCHNPDRPEGDITLTGEPIREEEDEEQSTFTDSYLALAPLVSYSEWSIGTDFRRTNCEPVTQPDFFGARASPLMKLLQEGHGDVKLDEKDLERMVTWMDTNALFYGTFESKDMARQLRGERIEGPALE